jgi:hypothetical protein
MKGGTGFTGQSPEAACRSVWQTPQALTLTRLRQRHVLDHQRLAELFDDCGFHGRHVSAPLQYAEQTSDATLRALDWNQAAQSLRNARATMTTR